jgi:uncharacterized protein (DUF2141 family)
MKSLSIFLVLGLVSFASANRPDSTRFDLTVTVTNIQNSKGKISFGLFRKQDSFPIKGKQFKGVFVETTNSKTKYTFQDLEKNGYAVAVYHDENNNGILDKNLVGAPTEAYGFSRNARAMFSAPSFDDAKVELSDNKSIEIWIK